MKCTECDIEECKENQECTLNKEHYKELYNSLDEQDRKILDTSFEVINESKGELNRLEEIQLFAKKANYKKIGLAFCTGLKVQAKKINEILSKDFEVVSIRCRVEGLTRKDINVGEDVSCCNPIAQADVLNKANVDMAILVGSCLGHDMLFFKHIKVPVTCLIVKDKKLKHKTIEALDL